MNDKVKGKTMPKRRRRVMTAEDLYKFQLIGACEISPDGNHVVYSLQRVDRKTEKKYSSLWVVDTRDGSQRQFTYSDHVDAQPRWSPDGKHIAFVSNRHNERQPQIYIIPFEGGEARRLSDMKGSIGSFRWSPDGRRLVCEFRKKDAEQAEREKDEQKKKLGVVSRHITRVFFKEDEAGFLPRERWHLWTVDATSGKARQITASRVFDEREPAWSADGKHIVFVSNRTKDPDLDPDAMDIFVVPARGGRARKIVTPVGFKGNPVFSPDGSQIAFTGMRGRGQWWTGPKMEAGSTFRCRCAETPISIRWLPAAHAARWLSRSVEQAWWELTRLIRPRRRSPISMRT
jgi:Tol biopolymer transport system component